MASIRKRAGRPKPWEARYHDPSGKPRSQSFARKSDAQRFLAKVEHDVLTGGYVAPAAGKVTFREYAEQWRTAQVHRASSADTVERRLRLDAYPVLGDRPLGSIRPSDVQAWVKGLTLRLAPSTVHVSHGIVASVLKSAVRDRLVSASPCEDTKLPQDTRAEVVPLTTEQVRRLEEAMPARLRAFVTVGAATGLRQGELLGLTVDRSGLRPPSARPMLKVDRQAVTVTGQEPHLGPPKTKASRRSIPLPRVAVDALAAHLAAHPATPRAVECRDAAGRARTETAELVFADTGGAPYRRQTLNRLFRDAVTAAELPAGTSPHDLRHYYASLLIRHGESVKVVQARLGHATSAETLDTYSHLWPDSEDRTREAIDSVLGPPVGQGRAKGVAEGGAV